MMTFNPNYLLNSQVVVENIGGFVTLRGELSECSGLERGSIELAPPPRAPGSRNVAVES